MFHCIPEKADIPRALKFWRQARVTPLHPPTHTQKKDHRLVAGWTSRRNRCVSLILLLLVFLLLLLKISQIYTRKDLTHGTDNSTKYKVFIQFLHGDLWCGGVWGSSPRKFWALNSSFPAFWWIFMHLFIPFSESIHAGNLYVMVNIDYYPNIKT